MLLQLLVSQVLANGLDHGSQIATADIEPIQVDQTEYVTIVRLEGKSFNSSDCCIFLWAETARCGRRNPWIPQVG